MLPIIRISLSISEIKMKFEHFYRAKIAHIGQVVLNTKALSENGKICH